MEAKQKIIKIERIIKMCLSCRYKDWYIFKYRCAWKDYKDIEDITTIPEWCPLEDYKGKNKP